MEEYLAFIDEIGRTIDGKYIYRFDFTYDTEVVWGEFFNVCPCSIIPDITPDTNALSHTVQIDIPVKLELAKNNMCFSMQDCIDGIIPMAFIDIYDPDNIILYENKPLIFRFGDEMENIFNICKSLGFNIGQIEEVIKSVDEELDNIIDNIGNDDIDF